MNKYSTNRQGLHTSDDDFWLDGPDHPLNGADLALLRSMDSIPDARDDVSKRVTTPTPPTPKPLSRKVTGGPRSSDRKDKKTLRTIASFQLPVGSADSSPLVEAPPTSKTALPPPAHHDLPKPLNDNHLPVWEKTRGRVKLAAANEAMEYLREPGTRPFSFSLNLTPERESEALRHPKGFCDYFKRQIERDLKRAGIDLPYWWFAVDIEGDRLHLHGGMLLSRKDVRAVDASLRRSGGKMTGPAGRYQLKLKARCDWGWGTYAIRNHGKVRRIIGDHMVSISQPLVRQARWVYQQYRSIMKALHDYST